MPIVAYNDLPSLKRIAGEGFDVLSQTDAKHQDIRELHIGFLNMMPDAAFLATERQFFRLTASATNIVQIFIHPIRCEGIVRNAEIEAHINQYYEDFETLKTKGLDALIVTGANPKFADLTQEDYWQHATEIFEWAENNVTSVFFSCLASHAVLQAQYRLLRQPLPQKLWGVYSHRVIDSKHPLVATINTRLDMPHSRGNDIAAEDFLNQNLKLLITGEDVGVAIATSHDGFRQIFCQGHPEYDTASLLKEYQREVGRFISGERTDYPPFPNGYGVSSAEVDNLLKHVESQVKSGQITADNLTQNFPQRDILNHLDNTWRDTAKAIFSNWLGLVYRVTHVERGKQFMDGIDPDNPIARWYK